LYGSRTFQEDETFLYLVFSLVQIQKVCYGVRPIVTEESFDKFATDLESLDMTAVNELIRRFEIGAETHPKNEKEEFAIQVANKIHTSRGLVIGSNHEKNRQKVELFSATRWLGTPTWFLTITFSDLNNPITLSYLGFDYELLMSGIDPGFTARIAAVYGNPVASERAFDFLVKNLIKFLVERGVLGEIESYYGTVE
ncbi:hypothetical protein BCR33DRAFT_639061, partial [Rhizoclosmatium globosum]